MGPDNSNASKSIPYGAHSIGEEEIAAVTEVLRNEFLTQGVQVGQFEQEFAATCEAQFAVAVNSATSALHIAYLGLGLGPGEYVWTVANTFVATANAALMCGAEVRFIDIETDTGLLSVSALEQALANTAPDRLPKLVVPVHYAGQSCDMARLFELSQHYGFKLVEDASHAVGAQYQGEKVGSCRYADAVVFSFHPVKIITSGEGGMVVTNDSALCKRLQSLRSHGIEKNVDTSLPWLYQQSELGFNYRMTDVQAAIGRVQLTKLSDFLAKRRAIAERYIDYIQHHLSSISTLPKSNDSSWHLFPILVPDNDKINLFNYLREQNIGVNVHYIPVDSQPYYRARLLDPVNQSAQQFYQREISIPIYPDLTLEQQQRVLTLLEEYPWS